MRHTAPSRFSMKTIARKSVLPISTLLLVLAGINANAQSQYFNTGIANGGMSSWDGANWNTSGSGSDAGPFASTWVSGDFARFYGNNSYTVTLNASEVNTGIYED